MGTTALLCGTKGQVTAGMLQAHFEVRVLHFFLSSNVAVHLYCTCFRCNVEYLFNSASLFLRETHELNLSQYRLIEIIQ